MIEHESVLRCIFLFALLLRVEASTAMSNFPKPKPPRWYVLQVLDFVSRYIPAYNAYLPTLYSEGPNGSDPSRALVIEIDEGRNPILAN